MHPSSQHGAGPGSHGGPHQYPPHWQGQLTPGPALWTPPHDQRQAYEALFRAADPANSGFVSGGAAVIFLRKSLLPNDTLRSIWELSDRRGGHLTRDEFFVAMRFVALAQDPRCPTLSNDLLVSTGHHSFPLPAMAPDPAEQPAAPDPFSSLGLSALHAPPPPKATSVLRPAVATECYEDDEFSGFAQSTPKPDAREEDAFGGFSQSGPSPPVASENDALSAFGDFPSVQEPLATQVFTQVLGGDDFLIGGPAASTVGAAAAAPAAPVRARAGLVDELMATSLTKVSSKANAAPSLEQLQRKKQASLAPKSDFDEWLPPMSAPAPIPMQGDSALTAKMSAIDALAEMDLAAATEEWDDYETSSKEKVQIDVAPAPTDDDAFGAFDAPTETKPDGVQGEDDVFGDFDGPSEPSPVDAKGEDDPFGSIDGPREEADFGAFDAPTETKPDGVQNEDDLFGDFDGPSELPPVDAKREDDAFGSIDGPREEAEFGAFDAPTETKPDGSFGASSVMPTIDPFTSLGSPDPRPGDTVDLLTCYQSHARRFYYKWLPLFCLQVLSRHCRRAAHWRNFSSS